MKFVDELSFLTWCEADRLKYRYPLVYSSLKRHGCALLARVSQVVLQTEAAFDFATLVDHLHEAVACIGADAAAFLSFLRDDCEESFRYLLACDLQWCVDYEQQGWFADDPWLAYARRHSEPIKASDICPGTAPRRQSFDWPSAMAAAMQSLLTECFDRAAQQSAPQRSLRQAFSCYYSGNFTDGFRDGYVGRVVRAGRRVAKPTFTRQRRGLSRSPLLPAT